MRGVALGMVLALLVTLPGCVTFGPPLMDGPCRNATTGRYETCPTGGGSTEGLLVGLGIAAGIGLIGGLVWLLTRKGQDAPPVAGEDHACRDSNGQTVMLSAGQSCERAGYTDAPAVTPPAGCALPVESVTVCLSTRGYQFAIPSPSACALGARSVRTIRLSCADLARPAYHACLAAEGDWQAVRSWETCASRGMTDAPGDFIPPGRPASQGVGPDAAPPPTTTPAVVAPDTTARETLRCFTTAGVVTTTQEASCASAGFRDSLPVAESAPSPAPGLATHTCRGRSGEMIDLPMVEPCGDGFVDAWRNDPAPRRGHHHRHR